MTGVVAGGQPIMQDARNDVRRHAAGLFAAILTAHAVGDKEDAAVRVGHVAVFIVRPANPERCGRLPVSRIPP